MTLRARIAAALALALAACGEGEPAPPPVVSCGATADSGTLGVGDPPTCGTASGLGTNAYDFASGAAGTYAVTVWTTFGDADLRVWGPGGLVGASLSIPPNWVDQVVFQAEASTGYAVEVSDANYAGTSSTYAVQVTGP